MQFYYFCCTVELHKKFDCPSFPVQGYAPSIVNQLCELSNAGVEELRVLQTILILITTSPAVEKDSLAKVIIPSTFVPL